MSLLSAQQQLRLAVRFMSRAYRASDEVESRELLTRALKHCQCSKHDTADALLVCRLRRYDKFCSLELDFYDVFGKPREAVHDKYARARSVLKEVQGESRALSDERDRGAFATKLLTAADSIQVFDSILSEKGFPASDPAPAPREVEAAPEPELIQRAQDRSFLGRHQMLMGAGLGAAATVIAALVTGYAVVYAAESADAKQVVVSLLPSGVNRASMDEIRRLEQQVRRAAQESTGPLDLGGLQLPRGNLSELPLQNANLAGANLFGADLQNSDLSGADLGRADLRGANLSGARLDRASFADAHYSSATSFPTGFDPHLHRLVAR